MDAAEVLCSIGHVATSAALTQTGLTRRELGALALSSAAHRPKRGLYVCAHLPDLQKRAAVVRARVDCVSVLRDNGIWAGNDYRLHLRMAIGASAPTSLTVLADRCGSSSSIVREMVSNDETIVRSSVAQGIATHWSARDELCAQLAAPASVSVIEALRQAMGCLAPDDVIAAVESAVHLRKISHRDVELLRGLAPRRLRSALSEIEFGAQSGVETLVRLGFRRMGFRVVSQAFVPGVGHVDNLVEDCVAVESDGRRFHEHTLENAYERDLATEHFGIRVVRVSPRIVLTQWSWLAETVARMIASMRRLG